MGRGLGLRKKGLGEVVDVPSALEKRYGLEVWKLGLRELISQD